jgi:hypothetical protein
MGPGALPGHPPSNWVTKMVSELLMASSCIQNACFLSLFNPYIPKWVELYFIQAGKRMGVRTLALSLQTPPREAWSLGARPAWHASWEQGLSLVIGLSNLWSTLRSRVKLLHSPHQSLPLQSYFLLPFVLLNSDTQGCFYYLVSWSLFF